MNSHNPTPNEGQQPASPSEGSAGQEPEHPAEPGSATPENSLRGENPTEPDNSLPRENPTEPLFPPPSDPHGGRAYGDPAYGTGTPASGGGYGRTAQPLNFFDWIRSHGIHRGRDRWIGGVSSGIAERMGIDPLIVRGIFIVLTLFAGIVIMSPPRRWFGSPGCRRLEV